MNPFKNDLASPGNFLPVVATASADASKQPNKNFISNKYPFCKIDYIIQVLKFSH